jgi:gamma-glutamyltranspeptidase/glutathione hydrolase
MKNHSTTIPSILGCKSNEIAMTTTGLVTDKAMVVSTRQRPRKLSSYHEKGNAFDAMVATELALAVSILKQEI